MLRLGIDIGGSSIKIGIVDDETGKVIGRSNPKFVYGDWDKNLSNIKSSVDDLLSSNNIALSDIASVGVGVPGILDKNHEVVLSAHNLGLSNVNVKKDIEKLYAGKEIKILNDADAATLAEYYFGIFKGKKTAVLLTLGTGLGGGVIIDGKLFTGGKNNGIELGHMKIEKDGALCTCGKKGCAEAYVSAKSIGDKFIKLYNETKDEEILNAAGGHTENINSEILNALVKNNHKGATNILEEFTSDLATIISNVCIFYDPEIIGLGGGLTQSSFLWIDKVIKKVNDMKFAHDTYEIKIAKFGKDAGFIGAAMACK